MRPEDYPVYWTILKLYNRIRCRLVGDSGWRYDDLVYLVLIRIISPDKRCDMCLEKVKLSEVLRNPDRFSDSRYFADNGEQLYRVVIHTDCTRCYSE